MSYHMYRIRSEQIISYLMLCRTRGPRGITEPTGRHGTGVGSQEPRACDGRVPATAWRFRHNLRPCSTCKHCAACTGCSCSWQSSMARADTRRIHLGHQSEAQEGQTWHQLKHPNPNRTRKSHDISSPPVQQAHVCKVLGNGLDPM